VRAPDAPSRLRDERARTRDLVVGEPGPSGFGSAGTRTRAEEEDDRGGEQGPAARPASGPQTGHLADYGAGVRAR